VLTIAIDTAARYWQTLEAPGGDLSLLDMNTSSLDALELCKATRRTSRWRNLPIIALIPGPDADWIERVFALGADDFVSQPIVGPELVARVVTRLPRQSFLPARSFEGG
jgi:PleD family two-component response regulator